MLYGKTAAPVLLQVQMLADEPGAAEGVQAAKYQILDQLHQKTGVQELAAQYRGQCAVVAGQMSMAPMMLVAARDSTLVRMT